MAQEADTQKSILDYLVIKKVFHWRQNSGAVSIPGPRNRFVRFGVTGAPDIFAVKDGRIYGLEVKSKVGRLNDNQLQFQIDFERAGGLYFVVRSLEDVLKTGL